MCGYRTGQVSLRDNLDVRVCVLISHDNFSLESIYFLDVSIFNVGLLVRNSTVSIFNSRWFVTDSRNLLIRAGEKSKNPRSEASYIQIPPLAG